MKIYFTSRRILPTTTSSTDYKQEGFSRFLKKIEINLRVSSRRILTTKQDNMLRSFKQHKDIKRFRADGDKFEDCHTWCVMDGKVIDPTPIGAGNEWAINFLKLEKTPIYVPHDDKTQKLFLEELIFRMVLESNTPNAPKRDCYNNPIFGWCYYNAWAFKQHNPTAKIVFGSVGFKYKKNNKKGRNKQDRYWVQYGSMYGCGKICNNDHDHDLARALKHAHNNNDLTLKLQLLNWVNANKQMKQHGNWGFVYKHDGTASYEDLGDDE
tara:strand:+ start:255 stop:1055 length:801 start_codon:yes stop_codon:yes gene_type:complete